MKVNAQNVLVMNKDFAKVVFKSTSNRLSEELDINLKGIMSILKANEDTCINIAGEDQIIPIYNKRVYIKGSCGYNYFCELTEQAIKALKQAAGIMIKKQKQYKKKMAA